MFLYFALILFAFFLLFFVYQKKGRAKARKKEKNQKCTKVSRCVAVGSYNQAAAGFCTGKGYNY